MERVKSFTTSANIKTDLSGVNYPKRRKRKKNAGHCDTRVRKGVARAAHCPCFMVQMRFLQIACLLSNQKTGLEIHVSHHALTGKARCSHLGTTCSPSPLVKQNYLLLGEVD
eukprot:scpid110799/ scgid6617/ 